MISLTGYKRPFFTTACLKLPFSSQSRHFGDARSSRSNRISASSMSPGLTGVRGTSHLIACDCTVELGDQASVRLHDARSRCNSAVLSDSSIAVHEHGKVLNPKEGPCIKPK